VLPPTVEAIMREIRAAEAEGRPSAELHERLRAAVGELRRASPQPLAQRPMPRPYQPRSMVITARRSQPAAERVQVVVDGAAGGAVGGSAVVGGKPSGGAAAARERSLAAAQAADLLRQIRVREAQGLPSDALHQQLQQAVDALKP
jgi:hypothetical protein